MAHPFAAKCSFYAPYRKPELLSIIVFYSESNIYTGLRVNVEFTTMEPGWPNNNYTASINKGGHNDASENQQCINPFSLKLLQTTDQCYPVLENMHAYQYGKY
jgi:hypothetical protein